MLKLETNDFLNLIPKTVLSRNGRIFYSGFDAFRSPSPLYVIGFNPGGNPNKHLAETVGADIAISQHRNNWSAYCDEEWEGKPAGTHGLQPRVINLFADLRKDLRTIPSSNLIFERSTRIKTLPGAIAAEDDCWAFHRFVVEKLCIRLIICLGGRTGKRVRSRLSANEEVDCFQENNNRHWRSYIHKNPSGLLVASLAHPSVADLTKPDTNPSVIVVRALKSIGA